MAKKKYEEANIEAIADTIREKTGTEKTYKTKDMASGVDEVFEAGKQAEYDAFWDGFQSDERVARDGYEYAFMRTRWTDEIFRPKKDLKAKNFYWAFYGTGITDLQACLDRQGVKLDTSQARNVAAIFQFASKCKRFPSLDLRSATVAITNLYHSCWSAETIGTIILKDDGSQVMNENCFYDTPKLKNISFEGTIGNGLKMAWSPLLSPTSLKSIVKHLKNYSGIADHTQTLTVKASAWEALEAEGLNDEDKAWLISLMPYVEEDIDLVTWAIVVDFFSWNLVLA